MAEDNKQEVTEEETLNGNEEQSTYTAEEVAEIKKSMQADSEKGVQKLINSNKVLDRVISEVNNVADNKEHLVSLYEESPEVAKIILDKYYEGQSIEEYKTEIEFQEDITDPKVIARQVEKQADEKYNNRVIDKGLTDYISKLEMNEDEESKFREEFAERRQLKSFKVSNIEKHLDKAYREISDSTNTNKIEATKKIASVMATGTGSSSSQSKSNTAKNVKDEAKSFISKYL